MKLINLLTKIHNWLSDKDFIWWPFSFLRPEPKNEMTLKLTSIMTACFSALAFIMFTAMAVMNNAFTFESAIQTLVVLLISFFLWFNLVTKPLWNRRARELKK